MLAFAPYFEVELENQQETGEFQVSSLTAIAQRLSSVSRGGLFQRSFLAVVQGHPKEHIERRSKKKVRRELQGSAKSASARGSWPLLGEGTGQRKSVIQCCKNE
eukprot:TRINITY_DN19421_c0_g1_i1.p1 TRINITY_DN19421_c0_g1~~TRINITY_DN19421_c0_g1_i1.p1  ORF type:complete len:104 (-),score=14.34 TRINITY_DN19421_c0_g1_i1:256-567(-)